MKSRKPRVQPDSFACLDDKEENLLVTVELPGVEKKNIEVRMRDDVIYVKAQREDVEFLGHVHSAEKIHPKKAKASFQNGLLDIKVPLKEKRSSALRIKID
jgi:HSP20 family molecular chaperone IbpA